MKEFVKGWRRKVGCVALGLAILILSCWTRRETHPWPGDNEEQRKILRDLAFALITPLSLFAAWFLLGKLPEQPSLGPEADDSATGRETSIRDEQFDVHLKNIHNAWSFSRRQR